MTLGFRRPLRMLLNQLQQHHRRAARLTVAAFPVAGSVAGQRGQLRISILLSEPKIREITLPHQPLLPTINFAAITYFDHQYAHSIVFYAADNTIIADAVFPEAAQR